MEGHINMLTVSFAMSPSEMSGSTPYLCSPIKGGKVVLLNMFILGQFFRAPKRMIRHSQVKLGREKGAW
jgi:hypothetical protein